MYKSNLIIKKGTSKGQFTSLQDGMGGMAGKQPWPSLSGTISHICAKSQDP